MSIGQAKDPAGIAAAIGTCDKKSTKHARSDAARWTAARSGKGR
ncbi:hypothetical protein [Streptomyces coeruleorubidus]